jgi:ribosomal protein S11
MSGMSTNSINSLASSYLQSILGTALQVTGLTGNASATSVSGTSGQQSDSGQLSPFAQLLSTLQQLQQSNPTEYQQVTQQIATNLQSAAQTATSDGNTSAANQLTQLATDFTTASQSGQLPNISDLAQAIGGGGHHHHHHGHHVSSTDSSTDSSSSSTSSSSSGTSTSTSSSTSPLEQLLAAFQANATQNEALNPLSIITNTLASAGITATNS